jgi:hypothetical protein
LIVVIQHIKLYHFITSIVNSLFINMIVIYKLFVIGGLNQVLIEDLLFFIKNLWFSSRLETWGNNYKIRRSNIKYIKRTSIIVKNATCIFPHNDRMPVVYHINKQAIHVYIDKFDLKFKNIYIIKNYLTAIMQMVLYPFIISIVIMLLIIVNWFKFR